jgi:hypothetical protein
MILYFRGRVIYPLCIEVLSPPLIYFYGFDNELGECSCVAAGVQYNTIFVSKYLTSKPIVSVNHNLMEEKPWRKRVKMNWR